MVRIALLGTGTMGRVHAEAYASIPSAQVVAVVGRNTQAAAAMAAPLGAEAFTELDPVLADLDLDVVDCCLPTPLHRPIVERVAAAGHHVICEKPLALGVEDGKRMIAVCETAGVHLLLAHVLRFFPPYRLLAQEVKAGRIGTPVIASLLRQGFYPTGSQGWFLDDTQSGGVLLDMLIHDFDWVLQQFGPAERVFARLIEHGNGNPAQQRFSQAFVTVRHRSGVLAQITGTWGHPGPFTTSVEIAGTEGLLQYHTETTEPIALLSAASATAEGDVPLPDLSVGENAFQTQLAHFLEVVSGTAEPLVRPEQALAALELALAARASAADRRSHTIEMGVVG